MKKLLFSCLALVGFMLPSLAQVSHDYNPNDREPVVNIKIAKDKVPEAVLKAVSNQFAADNPLSWSKFPYALKEYGWVYDIGASDVKLERYEVEMKTDKGDDLWALYSAKGELIETREMSKNVPVPRSVMNEFLKSQYKDWTIVGNKEIIRFYHDHNNSSVEQHFRITVEKDGVKRSISFNWQGSN
ncbi:MAG: hypothetical protein LLG13_14075 [Bacteroidales bacterium]|nr:hypothetical protein [Bacteroidales bacterium]